MPVFPLLFGGLMMLASVFPSWAHTSKGGHVYRDFCCNLTDCAEIADEAVVAGPDGYIVTLRKGDHPMVVSDVVRHIVPYRNVEPSTDGKFHACLYPNETTMRCFIAPPSGF